MQRQETKTPEEIANNYAIKNLSPAAGVAWLDGYRSRDEEVKELREIVQKFVTQQDDMIQLARLMDDEYIPLDYYHKAKQLLSKYSTH